MSFQCVITIYNKSFLNISLGKDKHLVYMFICVLAKSPAFKIFSKMTNQQFNILRVSKLNAHIDATMCK